MKIFIKQILVVYVRVWVQQTARAITFDWNLFVISRRWECEFRLK